MSDNASERILLALETSGDVCGVAVLREGILAVEQTFRHGMHLSERLTDTVETVLQAANLTLEDVTAFAVGIGPGSFTGTRIGVMTAKTLAAVCERPLYGISGLEALAAGYLGLRECLVVPILPCRTNVVFTARYLTDELTSVERAAPDALPVETLVSEIGESGSRYVLFCGAAVPRYETALRQELEAEDIVVSTGIERSPRASLVAMLADLRFARGEEGENPFELVPLYISPPPITLSKTPIPTGILP